MKKVKKGITFYIALLLGLLLAAFVICVVIMVFSPGTKIFGLSYYKASDVGEYYYAAVYDNKEVQNTPGTSELNDLDVENINVITNAHDLTLMHKTGADKNLDLFSIEIKNGTSGFASGDVYPAERSVKYFKDTKTLEVYAKIPLGFMVTGNSSSVNIEFPAGYESKNINLVVENAEGEKTKGSVLIGDSKSPSNLKPAETLLSSISIKATKGLTITEYAKIVNPTADLTIEVNGGIAVESTLYANNLTIISKNGTNNFAKDKDAFVVTGALNIETESVTANYGNISAASVNMKNVYGKQNFSDVTTASFEISGDSSQCNYTFKTVNIALGAGTFKVGSYATETEKENAARKCNFTIENLNGVRDILAGQVKVQNQSFTFRNFDIEMIGEENNYSQTLRFNDQVYNLTSVRDGDQITYTIELDDENKIVSTQTATDMHFEGIIKDIKFDVILNLLSPKNWNITATCAN